MSDLDDLQGPSGFLTMDACPEDVAHLQAAMDGVQSALLTFDQNLEIKYFNRRLALAFEVDADTAARCRTLIDLLEVSPVFDALMAQQAHELAIAAVARPDQAFVPIVLSSGPVSRVFTLSISRTTDGRYLSSFNDITAQCEAEARAVEFAMMDPLTGLANRRVLMEKLTSVLLPGVDGIAPSVLMLIDLDRFKIVNDTLGHPIGDALLRLVAKRLRSIVGADCLTARLGGDEFALLLPAAADYEKTKALAKRLVDLLARPYLIDGHLVHIGASIGIARAPMDGDEHDKLLRNADLALYQSKNAGRNTFSFFTSDMDERAHARRSMEIDLRKAIALSELEVHYQPQIDLESSNIVGFEALVRWRHPIRGLVMPDDFIPLAEELRIIAQIGDWVLRAACIEAARWPDHISVAVNVSPNQFDDAAGLLASIMKALKLSGLPSRRLEIEITEGVLLRNEKTVRETLRTLHDLGVKIAMDDFGTGYSSLSQLHSFPFDKIKIDRSLMNRRADGTDQTAIVRAITAMGASLGMLTIAEGVETSEQLAGIRSVGCTSVQGYLFSRPVVAGAVEGIIADFAAHNLQPQAA